jgi:hypothetical protein
VTPRPAETRFGGSFELWYIERMKSEIAGMPGCRRHVSEGRVSGMRKHLAPVTWYLTTST